MGESSNQRNLKNRFRLVFPRYYVSQSRQAIGIKGILHCSGESAFTLSSLELTIDDNPHDFFIRPLFGPDRRRVHHVAYFNLEISHEEVAVLPIHSAIRLTLRDENNEVVVRRPITYDVLLRGYFAKHGPLLKNVDAGTVAFFRQTIGRSVTLTSRHRNITDGAFAKWKLRAAWAAAKLFPIKRPTLIFEKDVRKYEESGRVLFEELIDRGQGDVYFILDKHCVDLSSVDTKYIDRIIQAHTFRHYLYFFKARNFYGSEALSHVLELRCQSLLVQRKLKSNNLNYVFLQHGVMYMVSLDSPARSSFTKNTFPKNGRIVVSSQKEANHFVELGGFSPEDLIVCGLPKFDRCFRYDDAKSIVVMPTWRPWEFNLSRVSPEKTTYYQMIDRITSAIPDELKDRVVVIPHPLFAGSTFGEGAVQSYDELLRNADTLITDYSSISFDAFYRGSNVIFYWEEIDECMSHYGGDTHIMLSQEDAFGDICRTPAELSESVRKRYGMPQDGQFVQNYKTIVEFHDGNNTDRLISELER